MTDPLRLGILGLGLAGGLMAEAVVAHNRVRLIAGADLSDDLRRRFTDCYAAETCDSAEALLARDDIDAIYIATPHQFHARHTVAAANARKHVLVEKPMALTLADCDVMIEAARRNEVRLIVGHTHGFDPTIAEMRRLIASGGVGPVSALTSLTYTDFLYRPRRPEELDTSLGGGILFNQVPHQVEIARTLIDSPIVAVSATSAVLDPARPTEGLCVAFLRFASGAVCTLTYSGYDRFDSDEFHDWVNEAGYIKAPQHGRTRRGLQDIGDKEADVRRRGRDFTASTAPAPYQPHFGALIVSCRDADLRATPAGFAVYDSTGKREHAIPTHAPRPGLAAALDALCSAVTGQSAPLHDGQFARATLQACLAIAQSAQTGAEIRL